MKIQIMGAKSTENLGFKSPLRKAKKYNFSVHFQILQKNKNKIDRNPKIVQTVMCLSIWLWLRTTYLGTLLLRWVPVSKAFLCLFHRAQINLPSKYSNTDMYNIHCNVYMQRKNGAIYSLNTSTYYLILLDPSQWRLKFI